MIISEIPGKLTCPYCGEEKYVPVIMTGSMLYGEEWSDSRHFWPMCPLHSRIQKCPHCSRYYHLQDVHLELAKTVAINGMQIKVDWPTPPYLKEADTQRQEPPHEDKEMEEIRERIWREADNNGYGNLTYKELADAEKAIITINADSKRREDYLLAFIHAYNDARLGRHAVKETDIPEEYQRCFWDYALQLIDCLGEEKALTAELWRELGCFDKSIELCQRSISNGTDANTAQMILDRARRKDAGVFIIHDEGFFALSPR